MSIPGWRAAHGGLFVILVGLTSLIPGIAQWPLYLLTPLAVYFLLVLVFKPLRQTFGWLKLGRLSWPVIAYTTGVVVVSCASLVIFESVAKPDVSELRSKAPALAFTYPLAFLIVFSLVNALLEELIFRGIAFDALEAELGIVLTLLILAVVFGCGHMMGGYPPGILGAVLASIYGLLLGLLRVYSGGLAASYLAHIFADATIVLLIFRP